MQPLAIPVVGGMISSLLHILLVTPVLFVWIENALLQDGTFCLRGKKVLQNPDSPYPAVAVDVTEHPVERPKKTKRLVQRKEKTTHH
jgi:hypothetical protein